LTVGAGLRRKIRDNPVAVTRFEGFRRKGHIAVLIVLRQRSVWQAVSDTNTTQLRLAGPESMNAVGLTTKGVQNVYYFKGES
jgi:hypothetical protein